jgi:hypothetical protein
MLRWRYTAFLFVLAATSLVGCIPATFVRIPAVRGRIIDADGKPIADAVVTIQAISNTSFEINSITTDKAGRFSRAEASNWIIYFLPQDRWFPRYALSGSIGKRSSALIEFEGGQVKPFGIGKSKIIRICDLPIPAVSQGRAFSR